MSNLETGWLNAFLSHIKKKKEKKRKDNPLYIQMTNNPLASADEYI